MKEYISRHRALEEIHKWCDPCGSGIEAILAVPAEDVAPVRNGQWENGDPLCPVCGKNKFKDLDADVWADWQPPYCPNCGAKMEEANVSN